MEKRTKQWRRQQAARVFKARMVYHAACGYGFLMDDGTISQNPHWFELAKTHWAQVYRTTGTPCSCWLCTYGKKYNRLAAKRETLRLLREEDM